MYRVCKWVGAEEGIAEIDCERKNIILFILSFYIANICRCENNIYLCGADRPKRRPDIADGRAPRIRGLRFRASPAVRRGERAGPTPDDA